MPDKKLEIYILNVGRGDTSVIKTPNNKYIIIDAVQPNKLVDLLTKIGLKKGGAIQNLIITHPHLDHFSAVNRLLAEYNIISVTLAPFWNEYGNGTATYRKMMENILLKEIQFNSVAGYIRIYPKEALNTADPFIEIIGPSNSLISQLERDNKLNTNHLSIMTRLTWDKFKIIFAADAQMENWSHFDSEGMLSEQCNILKSAHHGSCNGTQWERIDRLRPEYVIISSDPESGKDPLPDVVGSTIFAKYHDLYSSKIIALTSETGSIKIEVTEGKTKYSVHKYRENYDDNIILGNKNKLTAKDTDLEKLLDEGVKRLYP